MTTQATAPVGSEPRPSPERRLLSVLRDAGGRPVETQELRQAGIVDLAGAMFALEQVGYRIDRAYSGAENARSFLGYRLYE
jgi:hypothetical protein